MTALLEVEKVTVNFDGFRALNELTLSLEAGELRCIVGPNGAGKTTLMDVITGKTRAESGTVRFAGRDLTRLPEHVIVGLGIGRKFQRPTVFPNHTVFENLELTTHGSKRVTRTLFARLSSEERRAIERTLELIGLAEHRDRPAGLLSHGQKQWLEIGMLLVERPKLLLVDEPVAGMTQHEIERTEQILASLAGEHTVVVVEHDMDFVRSIAQTVTVLHEGRVLAEGPMQDVQSDPRVIEVYLGA
ncbi:MAG TPA: urea ABC transporter ATP-binding protein UrtD [Polyangiaceae bacterium]|nr:urea ABC transporter ATP-binding protein UrtD [Polyangiaceae bacterium]